MKFCLMVKVISYFCSVNTFNRTVRSHCDLGFHCLCLMMFQAEVSERSAVVKELNSSPSVSLGGSSVGGCLMEKRAFHQEGIPSEEQGSGWVYRDWARIWGTYRANISELPELFKLRPSEWSDRIFPALTRTFSFSWYLHSLLRFVRLGSGPSPSSWVAETGRLWGVRQCIW